MFRKEGYEMSVKKRVTGLVVLIATVVVVTTLGTLGSLGVLAKSDVEIKPMEKSVEVVLNDDSFNPKEITIPNGTTTTLVLKNKGVKDHTFTVKELGIDVEVKPGEEKTITVEPKQSGTYELICRFHYQQGMVGKVIVK
jgi:plastocyanin